MLRELTTEQKWAPVDRIIKAINIRKRCRNDLEEYIKHNFNK